MGAVHVRTPKNFVLEERLERYADAIETNPEAYAGDWREACAPAGSKPFEHLHLDLGCGKGTYLVERAHREPDALFIGMDQEPICIAYAAQKICEQELTNALVLPRGAASLPQLFAAGELDAITINFPTPQPKAKYAKKRLVHMDHLMLYRPLFAAGATVTLRTDSKPLRDYAPTCPITSMSSPMCLWAWKRPSRTLETVPARARSACLRNASTARPFPAFSCLRTHRCDATP